MNFDEAISAHVNWKVKLLGFINGTADKLDANKVEKDNQCDLGRWLYAEGSQYKKHPEYDRLKKEHAHFHKCAADVVKAVDAGKKDEAKKMLEQGKEFAICSIHVVTLIRDMREKTKN